LANKFAAAKRFGLEGCETLIPGMKAIIDTAADLSAQEVVIGMPHRGGCDLGLEFLQWLEREEIGSVPGWLLECHAGVPRASPGFQPDRRHATGRLAGAAASPL